MADDGCFSLHPRFRTAYIKVDEHLHVRGIAIVRNLKDLQDVPRLGHRLLRGRLGPGTVGRSTVTHHPSSHRHCRGRPGSARNASGAQGGSGQAWARVGDGCDESTNRDSAVRFCASLHFQIEWKALRTIWVGSLGAQSLGFSVDFHGTFEVESAASER